MATRIVDPFASGRFRRCLFDNRRFTFQGLETATAASAESREQSLVCLDCPMRTFGTFPDVVVDTLQLLFKDLTVLQMVVVPDLMIAFDVN